MRCSNGGLGREEGDLQSATAYMLLELRLDMLHKEERWAGVECDGRCDEVEGIEGCFRFRSPVAEYCTASSLTETTVFPRKHL